jgi:ribonuclease P/MRP protein subunit RPP25
VFVPAAAEILKRRVADIHQTTEISSMTIVDTWEPNEEGLDTIETTRRVSVITITLSKEPLDTDHIGYQPPLPADQVGG